MNAVRKSWWKGSNNSKDRKTAEEPRASTPVRGHAKTRRKSRAGKRQKRGSRENTAKAASEAGDAGTAGSSREQQERCEVVTPRVTHPHRTLGSPWAAQREARPSKRFQHRKDTQAPKAVSGDKQPHPYYMPIQYAAENNTADFDNEFEHRSTRQRIERYAHRAQQGVWAAETPAENDEVIQQRISEADPNDGAKKVKKLRVRKMNMYNGRRWQHDKHGRWISSAKEKNAAKKTEEPSRQQRAEISQQTPRKAPEVPQRPGKNDNEALDAQRIYEKASAKAGLPTERDVRPRAKTPRTAHSLAEPRLEVPPMDDHHFGHCQRQHRPAGKILEGALTHTFPDVQRVVHPPRHAPPQQHAIPQMFTQEHDAMQYRSRKVHLPQPGAYTHQVGSTYHLAIGERMAQRHAEAQKRAQAKIVRTRVYVGADGKRYDDPQTEHGMAHKYVEGILQDNAAPLRQQKQLEVGQRANESFLSRFDRAIPPMQQQGVPFPPRESTYGMLHDQTEHDAHRAEAQAALEAYNLAQQKARENAITQAAEVEPEAPEESKAKEPHSPPPEQDKAGDKKNEALGNTKMK